MSEPKDIESALLDAIEQLMPLPESVFKAREIIIDPELFAEIYEQFTPEQKAEWERRKGDAPTG